MEIRETLDISFSQSVFNSGNTSGERNGGNIMHAFKWQPEENASPQQERKQSL